MMTYTLLMLMVSGSSAICPASISDEQKLRAAVPGWSSEVISHPRPLRFVKIYSGIPSDRVILQGVREKDGATAWYFGGEEIWVVCQYSKSAIELMKNIGKPKSCRFVLDSDDASGAASLRCKQ
jgi:hypothetical protein